MTLHRHCAVGLEPTDTYEYHAIFLPEAAERLLILSRNIQFRYMKIPEKTLTLKDDLIKDFKEAIEALQWLISGHVFLAIYGKNAGDGQGLEFGRPWDLYLKLFTEPTRDIFTRLELE